MRPFLLAIALLSTALAGCADVAPHEESHSHDGVLVEHHDGPSHAATGHAGAGEHDMDAPHKGVHAGDHEAPGMQRPTFPPATGKVPTSEEARNMPQVSKLRYIGDVDLESSGYVVGNGTLEKPFVIEGLYVLGDLMLQDTDACVVIKNNWIGGQLTLNWNAQCVHVHHNHIYDLRVNENIRRTGYATGGLLERNEIEYVGQLRHYDGEFRYNTVGPMPEGGPWDEVRETTPVLDAGVLIANIDGFNEAMIHNNTFHGSVDLDFHGHHHGDGFFAPHSHYHGDDPANYTLHEHDHTQRWTSVAFRDNLVHDEWGYGLRYEDRNHAGDDRLANSEQEETLELDHWHRTDVVIASNTVDGAGIWVDVFNADDNHHKARNDGWLWLLDNTVIVRERDDGLLGLWVLPINRRSASRSTPARKWRCSSRATTPRSSQTTPTPWCRSGPRPAPWRTKWTVCTTPDSCSWTTKPRASRSVSRPVASPRSRSPCTTTTSATPPSRRSSTTP